MKRISDTSLTYLLLPLFAAGCPQSDTPAAPDAGSWAPATHEGTISIQDRSIHRLPQAGHGLSVLIEFTRPWRRPDFDEMPGTPAGCKVWLFDVVADPPPLAVGDVGVVTIEGTSAPIPNGCWYESPGGTVCPAVSGSDRAAVKHASVDPPAGTALFEVSEARFEPDDRGRYLALTGDPGGNSGLFPILAVLSPSTLLLRKPAAPDSEGFQASYRTLAGAGTTPGMPHQMPGDPLLDGDRVTVGLRPRDDMPFQFPATAPIPGGGSFTLDAASDRTLAEFPLDGSAFSIGCGGPGGTCNPAEISVLRILTTDAPTTNLPPFAMPPAARHQLEISCAEAGGDGVIDVPSQVSRYLQIAHQQGPLTRIRTAFMRNGYLLATNPPTLPRNPVRIVVGHQILGFRDP